MDFFAQATLKYPVLIHVFIYIELKLNNSLIWVKFVLFKLRKY